MKLSKLANTLAWGSNPEETLLECKRAIYRYIQSNVTATIFQIDENIGYEKEVINRAVVDLLREEHITYTGLKYHFPNIKVKIPPPPWKKNNS